MKATLIQLCKRISAKKDLGAFPKGARNQGVALLFALLLLVIMSALGIIMVLTVSPDMAINGYYGNYRGSFYAADSGMNIARQQLLNLVVAQVNMTPCTDWNDPLYCTFMPLKDPTGTANGALSNMTSTYGSFTSLQSGQAAKSWPENFEIKNTLTPPCTNSFALTTGYPKHRVVAAGVQADVMYSFTYNLCAQGRAQGGQRVATQENGQLKVDILGGTANPFQSLSVYGAFVNDYPPCLGPLVPGTMTGLMFANTDIATHQTSSWQFMPGGAYIFTDPVGQTDPNADFWFGGTCIKSPTSSYTRNGQTIRPTFQGGLQLNQPAKVLPANSYNQEWAVLDGMGCHENSGNVCGDPTSPPVTAPTNSDFRKYSLTDVHGNLWPANGANSGVYLPWACVGGPPCKNTYGYPDGNGGAFPGGGFYVKGNANITLSVGNDANGKPTQTYSINQNGTVTSITTNIAAQTTTVVSGNTTLTLAGIPQDLLTTQPATMLYVDGTITGLTGNGQGVPAIQDQVAMTITAAGDINVTGDVIYKTEPVTADVNDTLKTGWETMNQDLGLFTATGNIILKSPYSNHNLQVDGSQAALSSTCADGHHNSSCGFLVNGCIDTFNNVGGQIQYNIFGACMNTENTYFDRRYTARKDGFAPPWFPATTGALNVTQPIPQVTPSAQRLSWITTPQ
jgi:Tfp pilus assembly protein PilX